MARAYKDRSEEIWIYNHGAPVYDLEIDAITFLDVTLFKNGNTLASFTFPSERILRRSPSTNFVGLVWEYLDKGGREDWYDFEKIEEGNKFNIMAGMRYFFRARFNNILGESTEHYMGFPRGNRVSTVVPVEQGQKIFQVFSNLTNNYQMVSWEPKAENLFRLVSRLYKSGETPPMTKLLDFPSFGIPVTSYRDRTFKTLDEAVSN